MTFTNEWNYIIAAFAATWIGFLGYMVYLSRVTRRAEKAYEAGKGRTP
jgi:CcmD family protein